MTTEEAINYLRAVFMVLPYYSSHEEEALNMAITALRTQTDFNGTYVNIEWLKQVEAERDALKAAQVNVKLDRRLWKGCDICKTGGYLCGTINVMPFLSYSTQRTLFYFCPDCGKPLTEEAWAELEQRIGGNDGKIDS